MTDFHPSVNDLWQKFIEANPEYSDREFTAWYFCDTEDCANKLAELVKQGIKRGTTSMNYWYETAGEKLPEAGQLNVITDWNGKAQCITRTKKITILPFGEVGEDLAYIEGEGDKSLDYWRKAHISFFTRELEKLNIQFNEDMVVVFEEFEVVYQ